MCDQPIDERRLAMQIDLNVVVKAGKYEQPVGTIHRAGPSVSRPSRRLLIGVVEGSQELGVEVPDRSKPLCRDRSFDEYRITVKQMIKDPIRLSQFVGDQP